MQNFFKTYQKKWKVKNNRKESLLSKFCIEISVIIRFKQEKLLQEIQKQKKVKIQRNMNERKIYHIE